MGNTSCKTLECGNYAGLYNYCTKCRCEMCFCTEPKYGHVTCAKHDKALSKGFLWKYNGKKYGSTDIVRMLSHGGRI